MRCRYPGCNHIGEHRPYSKDAIPSVSTIAGLLNDGKAGAFGWAASLLTASEAVHSDEWLKHTGKMTDRAVENGYETCQHHKDGLCQACDYLRRHHDKVWRGKADLGTHIHHLALDWAQNKKVEVDPITNDYMDALEQFYRRHQPKFVELERTVLYTVPSLAYRGQFDFIADLYCPAHKQVCRWLVDIKTGGFHPVEQTLQLSGYRFAHYMTRWVNKVEERVGPMETVRHAGVLMLQGDGEFKLTELPADRSAHRVFLQLRLAWSFARQVNEQFKEEAA